MPSVQMLGEYSPTQEDRLHPNLVTFNAVLQACARARPALVDDAEFVLVRVLVNC